MSSTFSPNTNWELQGTGDNPNAWGTHLNDNVFTIGDLNFGGRLSISCAGSSNVTPTQTQADNIHHTLTGLLTGNIDYILPNKGRFYFIYNNTTGSFSITVKPSGGTGIVVPQGKRMIVYCNPTAGAAVAPMDSMSSLALTGALTVGTTLGVTGATALTGDLAVNTNKFTVAAATGNTVVAGTLGVTGDVAVATNKFNITAASGNTAIAGTLGVSAATTVTSTSANALAVGRQGATNPVLNVTASTASNVTGINLTGAAAGNRMAVAVTSSGADEGLSLDAKGSGTIRLNATATGAVEFSRNAVPTASDGSALGTTALMWSDLFLASGAVVNFNNGNVTLTHSAGALTSNVPLTANSFIPTNSSAPTNGLYLPAANVLSFSTNSTGRRLSITADGSLLSNTLTAIIDNGSGSTDGWSFDASANVTSVSNNGNNVFDMRRRASDGTLVQFRRDTTTVGSIAVTTTATAYNTSSDARIKENIQPLQLSDDFFDRMNPVTYDFRDSFTHRRGNEAKPAGVGFIAQELYEVVPFAVSKGDDNAALDASHSTFNMWGVDNSKLIPYIVKEIQNIRRTLGGIRN